MSARIMNALSRLAQGKMLAQLFTICETQQQISTQKLERYLETVGDQLKDCAFEIRTGYDAIAAERDQLKTRLAELESALDGLIASVGGGSKACGHDFKCGCALDKARRLLESE